MIPEYWDTMTVWEKIRALEHMFRIEDNQMSMQVLTNHVEMSKKELTSHFIDGWCIWSRKK